MNDRTTTARPEAPAPWDIGWSDENHMHFRVPGGPDVDLNLRDARWFSERLTSWTTEEACGWLLILGRPHRSTAPAVQVVETGAGPQVRVGRHHLSRSDALQLALDVGLAAVRAGDLQDAAVAR